MAIRHKYTAIKNIYTTLNDKGYGPAIFLTAKARQSSWLGKVMVADHDITIEMNREQLEKLRAEIDKVLKLI